MSGGRTKQKLVAFFLTAMDVSVGLAAAQGAVLTEGFYWNLDIAPAPSPERFKRPEHGAVPSAVRPASIPPFDTI